MSDLFFFDTETFSETPITRGTHAYAVGAEIIVCSWASGMTAPAKVADLTNDFGIGNLPFPEEVLDALNTPYIQIVGANFGNFDRTLLRYARGIVVDPERIIDTQVQALSHGLPGGLEKLGEIFNVSAADAKIKEGKSLIQLFCKPRPKNMDARRATKRSHPVDWERFLEYAKNDIPSMRHVYTHMPKWNYPGEGSGNRLAPERELWCLDQKINDRGFAVDRELASAATNAVAKAQKVLNSRTVDITLGDVEKASQRDRLLKHLLAEWGVELPDMTKSTLERRVNDETLPDAVRELLAIRLEASATSTSKYTALLNGVSEDGRLRGTMQFCGASRTGRWAGRIFQPQNLPRPNMKSADILLGIDALKNNIAHMLYDNPIAVASNAIRGSIVAEKGNKLVVADLSNIEGRVLAWLAGEKWKLQAFRDYDTVIGRDGNGKPLRAGPDLYVVGAANILGKRVEDITDDERQASGKVPELACLLEGTLVLTARGEIPIEQVTASDLVWDGGWVPTDGAVYRGYKDVIRYDGLCATPDHSVWVDRQADPIEFGRAAADGLRLVRSGPRHEAGVPETSEKADGGEATLHQSEGQRIQKLRSAGDTLRLFVFSAGVRLGSGEHRPPDAESRNRQDQQRRALRTGEFEVVFGSRKPVQPTPQRASRSVAPVSDGAPRDKVRRHHTEKSFGDGFYFRADSGQMVPTELQTKGRVWDLLNCGPRNRFTAAGRLVHNCGYQGAGGAFASMAALYGLELSSTEVCRIVDGWRDANQKIVGFWDKMNAAAWSATIEGGERRVGRITFDKVGNWLRMRLPSGRYLCYADPKIIPDPRWKGRNTLSYMGMDSYTRQWKRLTTYGGKLVENATQAVARDVLANGMTLCEDNGYPIVLDIHDEILAEVLDTDNYSVKEMAGYMSRVPDWADDDLPLSAAGFETYRYRKG